MTAAITKNPLTARDKELYGMQSIASQLPVKFDNGTEWNDLECYCKQCAAVLRADMVRGRVSRVIPSVLTQMRDKPRRSKMPFENWLNVAGCCP